MTSHEKIRAALLREREVRRASYFAAVEERDELATFANSPNALEYDQRALARAEARVGLALEAMRHWSDPLPISKVTSESAAPEALNAPLNAAGAADPVDAVVRRIMDS